MSSPPSPSRYEALLPIGSGGVAQVSVGRRRGEVRLVALKRAHAHVKEDAALAESLKHEARLASRLHHPNIVSVLDVEELDDELVLVLDYVEGCTLRALEGKLQKAVLERPRELVRVVLDIAAGLHAAHGAVDEHGHPLGLVHRDVSPSNVLLGLDGVARLADFGIAKAQFESTERTETGVLKGKSSYMAPEYVIHQQARPASDLFSLAVMCWEALSGARLFKGANDVETLMAVVAAEVRPIASERPALAPFDPLLARALAREPGERQPTVAHFAAELEAVARAHDLLATHAEVGALVQSLFADELADRRSQLEDEPETMIVAPISTARIAPPPPALPPAPVMSPPVMVKLVPRPVSPPPTVPTELTRQKRSARRDVFLLAGSLTLLGLAVALLAWQIRAEPPPPAPEPVVAPPPPAPTVAPLVVPDAAPTPSTSTSARPPAPRRRHHRRGVGGVQ